MGDELHVLREAARSADADGRLAEAYRRWLPLADAGDPEGMGAVGALLMYGLHRYDGFVQLADGPHPEVDAATVEADRARAGRYLAAASEAGFGPASFNLAGACVAGFGGGGWEERSARAAELYALAHAQGFTAFGGLTNAGGAGQPYLGLVEQHAAGKRPDPPGSPPPCDRG